MYIHIVQDLKRRPVEERSEKAWEVMGRNYEARFTSMKQDDNLFLKIFSAFVLQAWEAREAAFRQPNKAPELPLIVSDIKRKAAQMTPNAQDIDIEQLGGAAGMNVDDFSMAMPMGFGRHGLLHRTEGQGSAGSGAGGYPDKCELAAMGAGADQLDWTAMD